jgi:hypothetical protein
MCENCWIGHGSPSHTTPEIERAAELIGRVYQESPVGAPLHAELDDWNIDGTIRPWFGPGDDDDEFTPEFWAAVDELVGLLNGMPVADRAAALARHDGFVSAKP